MIGTDTPSGMSWYVPGAWRPRHAPKTPKYYLKSNLHIVLNISCKFPSCVKTLSHKTTEPSCGSLISLYNHVCGLFGLCEHGSTGAREGSIWWPNLQDICIYALYMFPESLKRIRWTIRKVWRIMWSADGHFLYINVKSYDRMFLRYRPVQAKNMNKSLLDLS